MTFGPVYRAAAAHSCHNRAATVRIHHPINSFLTAIYILNTTCKDRRNSYYCMTNYSSEGNYAAGVQPNVMLSRIMRMLDFSKSYLTPPRTFPSFLYFFRSFLLSWACFYCSVVSVAVRLLSDHDAFAHGVFGPARWFGTTGRRQGQESAHIFFTFVSLLTSSCSPYRFTFYCRDNGVKKKGWATLLVRVEILDLQR